MVEDPRKSSEPQPEPSAPRRPKAMPERLARSLARLTRPVHAEHGRGAAALLESWPEIVGPDLAPLGLPVKLALPRGRREGATLTLRGSGAAMLELQHQTPVLIARINAFAGHPLVARLAFVQGGLAAAGGGRPGPIARRRPVRKPLPTPAAVTAATERLSAIADPELREALAGLWSGLSGRSRGR